MREEKVQETNKQTKTNTKFKPTQCSGERLGEPSVGDGNGWAT